jgi:hypothetical protein
VLHAWQFTLTNQIAGSHFHGCSDVFHLGPQEDRPKVAGVITTLIRSSRAGGRMCFDFDVPNTVGKS